MANGDSEAGQQQHDSISDELESMRKIASVLDALRDEATRQRVLHWAIDRYGTSGVTVAPPAPEPAVVMRAATVDLNLAVEELGDLFEPSEKPAVPATRALPAPQAGVESMIKDFVADFRRLALEWQGA